MILVNGSEGIGSGWRSTIPNYNPRFLVDCLKKKMKGEVIESILPWFKNYLGIIIESDEASGFLCYGKCTIIDDCTLEIDELPIRKWTRDYKTFLEEISEGYEKVISKKESSKSKLKKGKKKTMSKKKDGSNIKKRIKRKHDSDDDDEDDVEWEKENKRNNKEENKKNNKEDVAPKEIKIEDIKEYHKGNNIKFVIKMKACPNRASDLTSD